MFLRSVIRQTLSLVPLFFFALFFSASTARAQSPALFQTYTTREGLAADYVTSLAFESNGAAWIGTPLGA
ncbi:MAG: hypothetical protein HY070_01600, partial [Chloroflexi bacterium]|nr:hypothetical protein [Chloroflexota bacterium]